MRKVGLLLSGCGRYDCTEIHEAVLAMLALDRRSVEIECLAPAGARSEIVDHASGQLTEGESRSVLIESARLSRGRIVPLREARASFLRALVIPGGQGVVRTLMIGAAEAGRRREADAEVDALVRAFVDQKKPIGTISLAGSLVSTILGLPLEEDPFSVPPTEIRVDEARGLVWTPGYLTGDRPGEVSIGIDRMVDEVVRRSASGLTVLS